MEDNTNHGEAVISAEPRGFQGGMPTIKVSRFIGGAPVAGSDTRKTSAAKGVVDTTMPQKPNRRRLSSRFEFLESDSSVSPIAQSGLSRAC